MTSSIHTAWAEERSSMLEDRIRYTPTSAFETFSWPEAEEAEREAVAAGARAVLERRQALWAERGIGLTRLYNEVDEGCRGRKP